jgi:hypothetical protein
MIKENIITILEVQNHLIAVVDEVVKNYDISNHLTTISILIK